MGSQNTDWTLVVLFSCTLVAIYTFPALFGEKDTGQEKLQMRFWWPFILFAALSGEEEEGT
jgi:hypothetical protein